VDGRDIAIIWRFSDGRSERLAQLATELVRLGPRASLTSGTPATAAAREATSTVPIVMVAVGDPVGSGFVASLSRPGANITGLSLYAETRTVGKRLELLKEAVPTVSRVGVLWNPTNPFEAFVLRELQGPAQALGISLRSFEVGEATGFEQVFAALAREPVDALYVSEGQLNFTHRGTISNLAAKVRIPAVYGLQEFVEAGGLIAYAASISDMYRRAAVYVAKILKGAKPADLPVEQPTKFELVINLKTAKALGLTIPQTLLLRADQVIE
jgi:putative tryptophan/tyrosine transport system substrate-binding protein